MLDSVDRAGTMYFGRAVDRTTVQATCSDLGGGIVSALTYKFLGVLRMTCWVHVYKKFTENRLGKYAKNTPRVQQYWRWIRLIHRASSPAMPTAIAGHVITWMREDNEHEVAQWFSETYLCEKNFTWTIGEPSNNKMFVRTSTDN